LAIARLGFNVVRLFLWGNVMDCCYSNDSHTIDALKENINRAIREIEPQTIDNVLQNWLNRMGY
jgi:hypothetical protein